MSTLRSALICAVGIAIVSGCQKDLAGPEPSLNDPVAGEPLPVDPGIICRVQNPEEGTPIVVTGGQLSPVPFDVPKNTKTALPSVTLVHSMALDGADGDRAETFFGGQPGEENASLLSWQSQTQMTLAIVDALELSRGIYDLRVQNPQGADATSAGSLAVVDKPSVVGVAPGITCVAQGSRTVTVTGQEILRVGDLAAEAIIGGKTYPVDELDDCVAIPHQGIDAALCTTATVTIPDADLDAASHIVEFQNPETAACKSDGDADGVLLNVVDPPQITGAEPALICTDEGERSLSLTGTNFFTVDGATPTVTLDGEEIAVDSVTGCATIQVVGLDVQVCTQIDITVSQGSLTEGNPEFVITNPDPIGCSTSSATVLTIPPSVTIDSITPASVCSDSAGVTDLVVAGAGFLRIDGIDPSVTFAGVDVTPTDFTGCIDLMVNGLMVEGCTGFTINTDLTGVALGPKELTVTNPDPSGCGATATDLFTVTGPPVITSVMPTNICSDTAQTVVIDGSGFAANPVVSVGGVIPDMVTVTADGATITAMFNNGLPAGTYDVAVDNGSGCSTTLAASLTVDPTPIVFFVDPPTIYNAVDFEVTIFTSGLAANAQEVTLIDSNANRTTLVGIQSPVRPNRILATIPANLPADTYEVEVVSDIGCVSVNNGTLVITDNVALVGLAIDPSFGSPTQPTPVTISVDAATPFISTPRAYLNPNPAMAGVSATALRAVVYQDPTTLTAVVPSGLTPGQYDLTVVNPGGQVGFAAQAFTVTVNEPPVITNVVPATLSNQSDEPAEIRGENFDAVNGATASLRCEDTMGVQTTYPVTVNSTTSTVVDVLVPSSQLSNGTICLVTVLNDDGASFTYSAISISNPSFNLEPWVAATPMNTARRGLGLEAGRPTNVSRFLYAVGGDDGLAANAFTSVESVAVNVFGDLQTWRDERYSLPQAKTLAGIERVGRFIYVVGGNDGTTTSNTVYRAQILDPLKTPEVIDLDASLGDGGGLAEGIYHYRVSAIFPNNDPSNPDGESLPGEVTVVDLPAVVDLIYLTLTWEVIPGASGYRVYRTPNPGDSLDALELLVEVQGGNTVTYVDTGGATNANEVPLPEGALGTWHGAGTLNTAREVLGVTAAPDPGDPTTWYLYAIGGYDGNAYLASIEYLPIVIAADDSQTIGSWTDATGVLSDAKGEIGALRIDNDSTDVIPAGETWIYVGPGRMGAGFTGNLESFLVPVGGDVAAPVDLNRSVSTTRAGYGFGASSDFIYIFGGANASASQDGISAELLTPSTLRPGAWNSLGVDFNEDRIFMGVAQESAFYFVAGGHDGAMALSSVDQTIQ